MEHMVLQSDCPHRLGLRAVVCTWKKTCAPGRKNVVARDRACRASVCTAVGAVSLQVFHSDGSPAVTGTGQDTWEAREDALNKTGDHVADVSVSLLRRGRHVKEGGLRIGAIERKIRVSDRMSSRLGETSG